METGFIAIGSLLVVQLVGFAYGYGKITQKLNDVCQKVQRNEMRLDKLEGARK